MSYDTFKLAARNSLDGGLKEGTLAGTTDTLSFVGYIAIRLEPVVYALYVHHRIKLTAYMETGCVHTASLEAEGTEVLVYILENALPTAILDLPALWTRQGHDRKIQVVYDGRVDLANYHTIIHWADYPSGYNMPVFQFSGHCGMSDVFSSASANNASIFGSWIMSNAHVTSENDGSLSAHPNYGGPYSAHSDSHHNSESAPAPVIPIATATSTDADHLTGVMLKYSKWRLVLSYLRLLIRLAICRGETGNPHFITTAPLETKAALIHRLFTESLLRANISAVELEQVSTSDGRIISENDILVMAGPHVAFQTINHARAGFGLHDIFSTLLKARLEHLLSHFMRPQSSRLPFDQNGLVWIFRTRCIKSILWHTAFRVTISAAATVATTPGLPMIMADLEPAVFRHTSVLPMETLAFIESLCYVSLFRKLESVVAQIPGATFDQPFYPPASTIYDEAVETLNIILPLDSDPGHPAFMTCMALLCDIANLSCSRIVGIYFKHPTFDMLMTCPSTPSKELFLKIEDTEDAIESWLQTHGLEILPYSLFVTASVLFGLVDYHDLMVLLEIQLQQAETNPSVFPPQGGRCFMEERMHRAQTEISLFSTAIVNLCELMNTRAIAPKLLPPVNTSYTGAYQTPSSLNCKRFQPTKETQDKCLAWLIMSSPFQDTMEVGSDVSQITPESPRRHQYPLRHDDQLLSLPRLTNAWIDNVKLGTYMIASYAKTDEPLPTDTSNAFTRKEDKTPDELMSVFHILDLKKQRAQAEVDMFSEAIALNAELEFTDDGTSSGKATMYETHLHNDWFNDWFSTSSAPSDASDILQHSQLSTVTLTFVLVLRINWLLKMHSEQSDKLCVKESDQSISIPRQTNWMVTMSKFPVMESSPYVSPPSKFLSLGSQTSILIDVECGIRTGPIISLEANELDGNDVEVPRDGIITQRLPAVQIHIPWIANVNTNQRGMWVQIVTPFLTTPLCTLDFRYYSLLLHGIDQHITTDVDAWAEGVAELTLSTSGNLIIPSTSFSSLPNSQCPSASEASYCVSSSIILLPRNNSNFHLDPPRRNTCLRLLGNSLTPLHIINGKVLEGEAGIFGSDPSSGFYATFCAKALLFAHSSNLACFAAVEVRMEGNYRAGVGRVGRESEEVVFYDRRMRTRYPHENVFAIYQTCQFDIQENEDVDEYRSSSGPPGSRMRVPSTVRPSGIGVALNQIFLEPTTMYAKVQVSQ
ncbi:uncharacterized protein F5891DRAFT_983963 [Suillus fuscotomentosus]|uniref:Uncharacterized protein n=1 Tax=Suillus fuscotomentosus TaxID=1912939 RepID=A0AAD4HHL2_9AGAM|nr:uncharacterized protein F5891DRAFT_983963 [Suillus fuscotomentosus]KAG1895784.1 hypothetical protein F5891DRAFT_983963 [Suillus fuscotomentosus]